MPQVSHAHGTRRRLYAHDLPADAVRLPLVLDVSDRVDPGVHGQPLVRIARRAMPALRGVCQRVNVLIISIIIIPTSEAAPNSVTIGVVLPERTGGASEAALQQTVSWLNAEGRQLPETRLVLDYLSASQPTLRHQLCRFLRGPVVALISLDNSCSVVQQLRRLTSELAVPFFVVNGFYCLPPSADGDGVFLSKAEHLDLVSLVTEWMTSTNKQGVTAVTTREQPPDRAFLLSARLSHLSQEMVRPGSADGEVRRLLLRLLNTPRPDADFLPAMWAFVLLTEPPRLAEILDEVDAAGLMTAASPWLVLADGWTDGGVTRLTLPADANVTVARRLLGRRLTAPLAAIARRMGRQALDSEETFAVSAVLAVAEALQAGWTDGWLPETVAAVDSVCRVDPARAAAAPALNNAIRARLTDWRVCLTCLEFELLASKYGRPAPTEAGPESGVAVGLLRAGLWNVTWGLDFTFPDLFKDAHLIMFTLPWHGMMDYDVDPRSGALVNRTGLGFRIMDTLAEELGFTYTVVEPPDGQWGLRLPNGSWTGLVRMLIDGRADVAGALALNPVRQTVIDNTQSFYTDYYDLLAPKARLDHGLFIYKDPFTDEVWLGIFVTMVVTSLLLYLMTRASPHYGPQPPGARRQGLFRFTNCLWYMYGATINQGGEHLPTALSGRLLVGFYWLFTLICVATYSGNLIATLTVPRVAPVVRDVDDLISGADTGWLTMAGTDLQQAIVNPVSVVSQGLERMFREGRGQFYANVGDALAKVKGGGWVDIASSLDVRFIVDEDMRRELSQNPNASDPCQLDIIPVHLMEITVVFGLQKRSPYKTAFDRYLRLMRESGLIQAWLRQFMPNASQCLPEPGGQARLMPAGQTGLSLTEMRGAFLLLLIGLLVSAAALLLEQLLRALRAACRRSRPPPPPPPADRAAKVTVMKTGYPPRQLHPAELEPALTSIKELTQGLARLKTAHHGPMGGDTHGERSVRRDSDLHRHTGGN
ncbi:glutamate receptor ionotropic, delta-1-like [Amphibalanus amphitrite]|uniref:glutamate receptor ionotropic, delta-1-like n=1 Tax=Amphibalanus amphitrite TaxID=1232801 RepID=UPI001C923320|nr:glutamate receptor ionotropic, delta-1-like [Amphibalanus amphitrite]